MSQSWLNGRLGSDGILRQTKNGGFVLSLRVAESFKLKDGWGTNWWNVTVFGQQAELYAPHCKKGVEIIANGFYEQSTWTDKQNVKKERTEFKVLKLGILMQMDRADPPVPRPDLKAVSNEEDDIPF